MNVFFHKQWSLVAAAALLLALSGCNPSSSSSGGENGGGGGGGTSVGSTGSPIVISDSSPHPSSVGTDSPSYYTRDLGAPNQGEVQISNMTGNVTVSLFLTSDFSATADTVKSSVGKADFTTDGSTGANNWYVQVEDDDGTGATFDIVITSGGG